MRFANQPQLPFPTRPSSQQAVRVSPRSGRTRPDPVAKPVKTRGVRRVVLDSVTRPNPLRTPETGPAGDSGGRRFASLRLRHAIETTGSCVLIAVFVVMVLFG